LPGKLLAGILRAASHALGFVSFNYTEGMIPEHVFHTHVFTVLNFLGNSN